MELKQTVVDHRLGTCDLYCWREVVLFTRRVLGFWAFSLPT